MMKRSFFYTSPGQSGGLALIYILMGIIVLFFGRSLLFTGARFVGLLLLIYGIWQLYSCMSQRSVQSSSLPLGVLGVIAGLFCMIFPGSLISILPSVVGLILIFNGILQITRSLTMKSLGMPSWLMSMITAVIMTALGLYVFTRPLSALSSLLHFCGILLIVQGILMLIGVSFNRRIY